MAIRATQTIPTNKNENEITKQSTEFYFVPVLTGDLSPGGATDSYNMKDRVFQPLSAFFVFQAFTGTEDFLQSNMNLDLQYYESGRSLGKSALISLCDVGYEIEEHTSSKF